MQFEIIKWLTISLSFLIKNTLLDINNMVEQNSVICQSNVFDTRVWEHTGPVNSISCGRLACFACRNKE